MAEIEFVEYTGDYPSLCYGRLYVKINGEMITFGELVDVLGIHEDYHGDDGIPNYPMFWSTGGSCDYRKEDDTIEKAPWKLAIHHPSEYPDDIIKLLPQILEIFNKNVEWGCCGGCL